MKVQICKGKTCRERFCEYIHTRLKNDAKKFDLDIEIEESPCMGECQKWPNLKCNWEIHNNMNPAKAAEFIKPKLNKKTK